MIFGFSVHLSAENGVGQSCGLIASLGIRSQDNEAGSGLQPHPDGLPNRPFCRDIRAVLAFICSASEGLITQQQQTLGKHPETLTDERVQQKKNRNTNAQEDTRRHVLIHTRVALFLAVPLSGSDLHHSMNKAAERRERGGGRGGEMGVEERERRWQIQRNEFPGVK